LSFVDLHIIITEPRCSCIPCTDVLGDEDNQDIHRASWKVVLPHNMCQCKKRSFHILNRSELLVLRLQIKAERQKIQLLN